MSSGRKNGNARSLEYTAPETPNFLKALKAQVSVNERAKYGGGQTQSGDQLDSLLSTSSRTDTHSSSDNTDNDDDDGAQIVVLNDKRHLTAQQAQEARAAARNQPPPPPSEQRKQTDKQVSTASGQRNAAKRRRDPIIITAEDDDDDPNGANFLTNALTAPPTAKKAKTPSGKSDGGTLEDVKQLLRSEKQSHLAAKPTSTTAKADEKRARKTKLAQTAKLKSGKGLSFSLDDD